jgi:hypothetical protein
MCQKPKFAHKGWAGCQRGVELRVLHNGYTQAFFALSRKIAGRFL